MRILTAREMAEVDRRTVEGGIAMRELMERAGEAVARFCVRRYPDARRVAVICGKGNNGGDGLVAARVMAAGGRVQVTAVLMGRAGDFEGLAGEMLGLLRESASGEPVVQVIEMVEEAGVRGALGAGFDLVVDAVVGTGFKPPLRGLAVTVREVLCGIPVPVVAVDLPSGWDADSMAETVEGAFRADAVVTFTAPKVAHVFGHMTVGALDGGTFGPVVIAGIGSPDEVVTSATVLSSPRMHWTGGAKDLAESPRRINSNKGKFGHVLVVGGSYGKAGAPSMASLAALRSGAGLVTAAVPVGIVNMVARIAPELMLVPLTEGPEGAVSFRHLGGVRLDEVLKKITVVAVGPGLSTTLDAEAFARQIVEKTEMPIVVDADGLNAFRDQTRLLDGTGRVMVLTPHPGEMATLLGVTVREVEADRLNLARKFAMEHCLTLVLKGWRTLVAHPDGTVAVNTTGNPGMAKGGSGDILTGIVAAMLAQFPEEPGRAVEAAVYLHGLAADFAVIAKDEHTVLATDTVAHLSDAFRYRVRGKDGLVWLAGMRG